MKVALYFENPDDLIQELRAVEEVSKRVGKFFIAFAAREECEFEMDGQKFFACAFDELSFDEFDYIIFPDDLSKINFPPEKILTPAQFTKKFLKDNPPPLLFFTYANAKYHVFATLYPLFALTSNPEAVVEIILSDYEYFTKHYTNIIQFYEKTYPGKVRYTPVEAKNILPNSVRFLIQPTLKAKYVYIGDVDIFLLEDILDYQLNFMTKHQSDFGNVLRNDYQLTGLHFIPYDKMYPIKVPSNIDLLRTNDEVLLCHLMREKNLRFPVKATFNERKIHGVHISFFSRPPLISMTTLDKSVYFPSWGPRDFVEKYLNVRYTAPIKNFIEHIHPYQIDLRRLIQFVDMWAFFLRCHPDQDLLA